MESAHFHLLVNHLPIIIPGVASVLLITGLLMKSDVIKRVAFGLFVMGAISAMPAFFSGEDAEEAVEHLPEISERLIHTHEEAAESFAILSYLLGVMALISLWANYRKLKPAKITQYLVLLMATVVLYYAKVTGTTGGEIRHTEIRSEAAIQQAAADTLTGGTEENEGEGEHEKD